MQSRGKSSKDHASSAGEVLRDPKSSKAGTSADASVRTQKPVARSRSEKVLQETAERDSDALERLARR
jgi:hypothetical protein